MPCFSQVSASRLLTCRPILSELAYEAIKKYDFSILCGWRGKEEQDRAFNEGHSKLRFPNSKHNAVASDGKPSSLAFDFSPYPASFDPYPRYSLIAGYLMGLGYARGIFVRWGADWDDDGIITEHTLIDWGQIGRAHV